MTRQTIIALIGAGAALGLVSNETNAGATRSFPVRINIAERTANGAVGAARNDADERMRIRCYLSGPNLHGNNTGICSAAGRADDQGGIFTGLSCWTRDPELIKSIRSVSAHSFISFRAGPGTRNNQCLYLNVDNGSHYIPANR